MKLTKLKSEKLVFENYLYALLMSFHLFNTINLLLGPSGHSKVVHKGKLAAIYTLMHRARRHLFNAHCRLGTHNYKGHSIVRSMLQHKQTVDPGQVAFLIEGAQDFQRAVALLTQAYSLAKIHDPILAAQIRKSVEYRTKWVYDPVRRAKPRKDGLSFGAQHPAIRRVLTIANAVSLKFADDLKEIAEPGNKADRLFFSGILSYEKPRLQTPDSRVKALKGLDELVRLASELHTDIDSSKTEKLLAHAQEIRKLMAESPSSK